MTQFIIHVNMYTAQTMGKYSGLHSHVHHHCNYVKPSNKELSWILMRKAEIYCLQLLI